MTWFTKFLAVLACLAPWTAQASTAPCGPVTQATSLYPVSAKLWQVGRRTLVEANGAMSFGEQASPTLYSFGAIDERVIAVFDLGAEQYDVFTRTRRGFGLYRWNQSTYDTPSLSLILARPLTYVEGTHTYTQPLVDVQADATQYRLLTGFHVTTWNRVQADAGTWSGVVSRIGFCSTQDTRCPRGAAFYPWGSNVAIAQMRRSSGSRVTLGVQFAPTSGTIAYVSAPPMGIDAGRNYTQSLRQAVARPAGTPSVLAATVPTTYNTGHVIATGDLSVERLESLPDYPISAAFIDPTRPGATDGAIGFLHDGVLLYRQGRAACRLLAGDEFPNVKSIVIWTSNGQLVVSALDSGGRKLTVTVPQ